MKRHTTDEAFDKAHELVSGRKSNITVKRSMFIKLLMDHSSMVGKLQDQGEKLEKGRRAK